MADEYSSTRETKEFKTLSAAVARAVELHDDGALVSIAYMPDARSGHVGGFIRAVGPIEFKTIVEAARVR